MAALAALAAACRHHCTSRAGNMHLAQQVQLCTLAWFAAAPNVQEVEKFFIDGGWLFPKKHIHYWTGLRWAPGRAQYGHWPALRAAVGPAAAAEERAPLARSPADAALSPGQPARHQSTPRLPNHPLTGCAREAGGTSLM